MQLIVTAEVMKINAALIIVSILSLIGRVVSTNNTILEDLRRETEIPLLQMSRTSFQSRLEG